MNVICGLIGVIAGDVIAHLLLRIDMMASIDRYATEVMLLKSAVQTCCSRLDLMDSICDIRHARGNASNRLREKYSDLVDFDLGHGCGICGHCGCILYKNKLIRTTTLLGEEVKCYRCGTVLS